MTSKSTKPADSRPAPSASGSVLKSLSPAPSRSNTRRIVVIGAPSDIPRALEHGAVVAGRFSVEAMLAIDTETDDAADISRRLSELLRDRSADAMLMTGSVGRSAMRVIADLALLHHCELLAVLPTDILADHDPVVVWTGDSPVVQLTRLPQRRGELAIKRAIDVAGASVGLLLAAPVIAVLAALICLESRGAPLFAHKRVGRGGRPFSCLKLRTMRTGAEELLKSDAALYEEYRRNHFKIPDHQDPRTTRLGRLLRRTSLDELPQLWNVLRGDMSIVGPRPVVEDELSMYEHCVDLLLSVRPGITGAWAVSGRHDVGYPERCGIELSYVRGWRLSHDVSIAWRTAAVVLRIGAGR
jgi:lipopolysaccharide/colanic/teichoic acid biosynthesis glycosyltransferase